MSDLPGSTDGGWRPIETAPAGVRGIFYIVWDFRGPTTALGEISRYPGADFCIADGHPGAVPATHWMPLPEPPK